MGDMGRLYATKLIAAGWKVNVCDRPERYEALREEFKGELGRVSVSDGRSGELNVRVFLTL